MSGKMTGIVPISKKCIRMPTLSKIHKLLQHSLIRNPGLLNPNSEIILTNPNLWATNDYKETFVFEWDDFVELDHESQILFESCGFRLGVLAEAVFEQWLIQNQIDYVRGIQIFDSETGRKTLGELDFVYNHHGQWLHCELAAKIYCYRPVENDFIGPNRRDFLHLKLQNLHNHQLPLGTSAVTQDALKKVNIGPIKNSNIHFCGRIFYPKDHYEQINQLHPNHLKGTYFERNLPLSNFPKDYVLMLIPRYMWFIPAIQLKNIQSVDLHYSEFAELQSINLDKPVEQKYLEEVISRHQSSGKSLMFILFQPFCEGWREVERILLVPHVLSETSE